MTSGGLGAPLSLDGRAVSGLSAGGPGGGSPALGCAGGDRCLLQMMSIVQVSHSDADGVS